MATAFLNHCILNGGSVTPESKTIGLPIHAGPGSSNIPAELRSTGSTNSLLVSSVSETIPVPLPMSSTTALKLKLFGVAIGIVKVIVPLSEPPIGMILVVVV
jgi:hypothetical protein